MAPRPDVHEAAAWLLTPGAVRERAHQLLALAERDALPHFVYRPERLGLAVERVLAVTRESYPDLKVPFHSRWRHFTVGGKDRWAALRAELPDDPLEGARIRFDLAVTSVLLDAGAGPQWRYHEAGGAMHARSEGLAVASFDMFRAGAFAGDPRWPWRADAAALSGFDAARLAAGMQVAADNPLIGLDGRAALLRALGAAVANAPELFGTPARIGNLFDHLRGRARDGALPAAAIFSAVMRGFGTIWPGRHTLGGVSLGDAWRHSSARAEDASDGFMPFHKLSQWLTYSLIEPLQDAGVAVVDIDALTGLPEYRNGGLLLDLEVLVPRDAGLATRRLVPADEPVVEWRALTVALLDRIAAAMRDRLGLDAQALPLAKVLEGGTWAAGRRVARERRADGGPPLIIDSDGTVF